MLAFTNIFRLIRLPNLVIIAITMLLVKYAMIGPLLGIIHFEGGMNMAEFSLLVLATLLISVGGYVVNDLSDTNPDSVNKPGKNLVGTVVSEKTANNIYWITTVSGVLMGTLVSYLINQINFGLIFLFSAGLLWFYSQKYSCQPLVGNIVIAALSAISFGIVWLFEFYALSSKPYLFTEVQSNFDLVTRMVSIYMCFAFIISLIREIVKDIEDYPGDDRFGCRTLPVKYGISVARLIASSVSLITLVFLIILQVYFSRAGLYPLFYGFAFLVVLMLLIIFKLQKSSKKEDYSNVSTLLKYLMLAGVLSMILFNFI